jgi:hypothetical protein
MPMNLQVMHSTAWVLIRERSEINDDSIHRTVIVATNGTEYVGAKLQR